MNTNDPDFPTALTMEDVARILSVSPDTVRRWQHMDNPPVRGRKVGKRYLFDRQELRRALGPVIETRC
jgi:excisionase family DNA binding protein